MSGTPRLLDCGRGVATIENKWARPMPGRRMGLPLVAPSAFPEALVRRSPRDDLDAEDRVLGFVTGAQLLAKHAPMRRGARWVGNLFPHRASEQVRKLK